MAVGDSRYTKQQRAAVIAACIDGPKRRSVPDVLRSAAAGELEHDGERLDAFEGNVGTFRDYVARELRRRRRADVITAGGGNAGAALAARLVAVGEREVRRLEARAAKGDATAREITNVARMIGELVKLSAAAGVPGPRTEQPAAGDTPTTNGGDTHTTGAIEEIAGAAPTTPAPIV